MKVISDIIDVIGYQVDVPKPFHGFHIFWIVLMIAVSVALPIIFRKSNESTYNRIVLIAWIIMIVLEFYKQFFFTFSHDDGVYFKYQWYIFPFQFCSSPMQDFPKLLTARPFTARKKWLLLLQTPMRILKNTNPKMKVGCKFSSII